MTQQGQTTMRNALKLVAFLITTLAVIAAVISFFVGDSKPSKNIESRITWLDDPAATLHLIDILQPDVQQGFAHTDGYINRGYTAHASWLKIEVPANTDASEELYLWVDPPNLDSLDVFMKYQLGEDSNAYLHKVGGDTQQEITTQSNLPGHVFSLDELDRTQPIIYVRTQTSAAHTLSIKLLDENELFGAVQAKISFQFAYLGITLALILLNGVLAIRLKDSLYGTHTGYLIAICLLFMSNGGMVQTSVFESLRDTSNLLSGLGLGLSHFFYVLFTILFFRLKEKLPVLYVLMLGSLLLSALVALSSVTPLFPVLAGIMQISSASLVTIAFTLALQKAANGNFTDRLFSLTYSIMFISIVVTVLRIFGFIETSTLTLQAFQYGSLVHMLLMTVSISQRVIDAEAKLSQAERSAKNQALALAKNMTTELQLKTDELERSLEQEKEMREQQTLFIDTVSHEFRTPLARIRNNLDIMQTKKEITEKRYSMMDNAIRQLNSLLSDSLSKLRGGTQHVSDFRPLNLIDHLEFLLNEISEVENHIQFNVDYEDDEIIVLADKDSLQIVLRNLIENAIKYSRRIPGQSTKNVWIKVMQNNGGARFTIKNKSQPVNPSELPTLQEKFVRGSNKSALTGMGMGLYIVEKIIQSHQGKLTTTMEHPDFFVVEITLRTVGENPAAS
jgi:signal transduction histidine kinase